MERSLPHPLTRAEGAFQTTLQANSDDLPLLGSKVGALQVDPMKPTMKAHGTKRFKLKYD